MRIKKRKKHTNCLNCNFVFDMEEDNFCPRCGQENDDKRKAVYWFIRDFIEDVISIDNRLFQSILPFLFRPGKLTKAYMEGRRKTYVSPIRLYLTFSILYFFIFNFVLEEEANFDDDSFSHQTLKESFAKDEQPDSTQRKNVSPRVDSLLQIADSLQQKNPKKSKPKKRRGNNLNFTISGISVAEVARLMEMPGMTEEAVLDSLGMEHTFLNRFIVNRSVHIAELTPKEILQSYLEKVPLTIFFVVPVFALLLTLFYYRRYYVENLVFSLHIHSFWFFILSVFISGSYFYDMPEWLLLTGILIIIIYNYKAFRNVYKQSRILTLFKLFWLFIFYIVLLVCALVVSFLINFILV